MCLNPFEQIMFTILNVTWNVTNEEEVDGSFLLNIEISNWCSDTAKCYQTNKYAPNFPYLKSGPCQQPQDMSLHMPTRHRLRCEAKRIAIPSIFRASSVYPMTIGKHLLPKKIKNTLSRSCKRKRKAVETTLIAEWEAIYPAVYLRKDWRLLTDALSATGGLEELRSKAVVPNSFWAMPHLNIAKNHDPLLVKYKFCDPKFYKYLLKFKSPFGMFFGSSYKHISY